MRHQANHDSLTSLLNRMLLSARLTEAATGAAEGGYSFAVLCLDLDGFKASMTRMGHEAGVRLLARVASRSASRRTTALA